jgi:hypothetical protein
VYKKKETFRNQPYCSNLNAFSIAHMLNRGALNIDGVHILEKGDL